MIRSLLVCLILLTGCATSDPPRRASAPSRAPEITAAQAQHRAARQQVKDLESRVVLDQIKLARVREQTEPAREAYVAALAIPTPEDALLATDDVYFRRATSSPKYLAIQQNLEDATAAVSGALQRAAARPNQIDDSMFATMQEMWDATQHVPGAAMPEAQEVARLKEKVERLRGPEPEFADAVARFTDQCDRMHEFWAQTTKQRYEDPARDDDFRRAEARYAQRMEATRAWTESQRAIVEAERQLEEDRLALREARTRSSLARQHVEQLERQTAGAD